MDKEAIKKNFSRCARYYDRYSTIQTLCASRLISKVDNNGFSNILDIGCGTGNYTELLREKFPFAQIMAIDISKEMIDIAKKKLKDKRVEFIVADGEEIDFEEKFDLISSNATFQWFEGLDKALSRYKRFLNQDAVILFSILGPRTFYELNSSLRKLLGKDISISSYNFIESKAIEKILKSIFKKSKIEKEIYKERYASLVELLKKIKYTGTKGDTLNGNGLWTPNIINNLEEIYKKRFKDLVATYEVYFCKGVK